jgi:hypothetical protein
VFAVCDDSRPHACPNVSQRHRDAALLLHAGRYCAQRPARLKRIACGPYRSKPCTTLARIVALECSTGLCNIRIGMVDPIWLRGRFDL